MRRGVFVAITLAVGLIVAAGPGCRGGGFDLPVRPLQSYEELGVLSPEEALLRILDLPEGARDVIRTPAQPPDQATLPVPPPHPVSGPVQAGASAECLVFPPGLEGLPLGGTIERLHPVWEPEVDPHHNAHLLRPSRGTRDRIRAKAIALRVSGRTIVWISLDVVFVDETMVARISRRLRKAGLAVDLTLVSATHTHSGPGAILRPKFLWLVCDRFLPAAGEFVVESVVRVVRAAVGRLAPASIGWGEAEVAGLIRNRRHPGQPAASRARFLKVTDHEGRPLAALVLAPIHGTVLPSSNLAFSADISGSLERSLEEALGPGVVAVHVQGAEGDQAPAQLDLEPPPTALDRIGGELGRRLARAFRSTPVHSETEVDWVAGRWEPPPPVLRPGLLRPEIPRWVAVPLGHLVDRHAPVTALRLDGTVVVTVPAEPILEVGRSISELGQESGFAVTETAGLTGGYLGYVVSPDEYQVGGYEAMITLFGPRTAPSLTEHVARLLQALRRRRGAD